MLVFQSHIISLSHLKMKSQSVTRRFLLSHLSAIFSVSFSSKSQYYAVLGPEFVFEALRTDPIGSEAADGRTLKFLANVDPVDVARALSGKQL